MVFAAIVAPDILCVLLCLLAAVIDLRTGLIPNWLTVGGALAGLVLNSLLFGLALGPGAVLSLGLLPSVAGCLLLLIVFGLLGTFRFVGMGDVKLMAAVGALLRWPAALPALVYVTLSGGALALAYALLRGQLGTVLRNIMVVGRQVVTRRDPGRRVEMHRIPYGLAIFIGAAWAVAARHWTWLRLP